MLILLPASNTQQHQAFRRITSSKFDNMLIGFTRTIGGHHFYNWLKGRKPWNLLLRNKFVPDTQCWVRQPIYAYNTFYGISSMRWSTNLCPELAGVSGAYLGGNSTGGFSCSNPGKNSGCVF